MHDLVSAVEAVLGAANVGPRVLRPGALQPETGGGARRVNTAVQRPAPITEFIKKEMFYVPPGK